MGFQVLLLGRAERDLQKIAAYVEAELNLAASDWFLGLTHAVMSLQRLPKRGTLLGGSVPRRQILYDTQPPLYRIIYLVDEVNRKMRVLQVRHGRGGLSGKM